MSQSTKSSMTKTEHYFMMKWIIKKFSRDESICILNRVIKECQFENGVLKSEISELKDNIKKPINSEFKNNNYKNTIKNLEQKCRDLEYQLIANNVPLPKKYQDLKSKDLKYDVIKNKVNHQNNKT